MNQLITYHLPFLYMKLVIDDLSQSAKYFQSVHSMSTLHTDQMNQQI